MTASSVFSRSFRRNPYKTSTYICRHETTYGYRWLINIGISLVDISQTSMSVSQTGSIGSSVFAALRLSNFWDNLGTSNPREPSRIDLHRTTRLSLDILIDTHLACFGLLSTTLHPKYICCTHSQLNLRFDIRCLVQHAGGLVQQALSRLCNLLQVSSHAR